MLKSVFIFSFTDQFQRMRAFSVQSGQQRHSAAGLRSGLAGKAGNGSAARKQWSRFPVKHVRYPMCL